MFTHLIACIGFAAAAQQPPSGPHAMPEMMHQPEIDEDMATEPPRTMERPRGVYQYDLDSAYLPDLVGGYVEVDLDATSSTVTAASQEVLREVATLLKERPGIDVWVTAEVESDSKTELRRAALGVEAVVSMLRDLEIERVPFRIWRHDEERVPAPVDVLEIRVMTSVDRPVS